MRALAISPTLSLVCRWSPYTGCVIVPFCSPRRWAPLSYLLLLLLGVVTHSPVDAEAAEVGPEADLCAEINALPPGGELVLGPGDYRGPCVIRSGGLPGRPTVIRAKDLGQRPRIVYDGDRSNVIDVRADHVLIKGLAIGPTRRNVDGIRVFSRADVAVEECEFQGLGGIAVVANHVSIRGLTVRRNVVRDSGATAMYFGCHDGLTCVATDLLIEGNYIEGVRAPDPEIGYGIQVKLNSPAIIRGNVVADTKGPGIMVYGAVDGARMSTIERNFATGSVRSAGIVVGGGPVIVRNNILVGNRGGGIGLEDYGGRGLLRGIVIAHNTAFRNELVTVTTSRNGVQDALIVNNAALDPSGSRSLPTAVPGFRIMGNVDCGQVTLCFVDPESRDFSPMPGGILPAAGLIVPGAAGPTEDFFGRVRGLPPAVGAVEGLEGPVMLGVRP
jgi:hypothetical protein